VFRVTRVYRFAASHRLHAPELSEAANRELYGKCNNPHGHGHNYVLSVSARGPAAPETGRAADPAALDALVNRVAIEPMDRRDLNSEIPAFAGVVPTSENLAREIGRRLKAGWSTAFAGPWPKLDRVRIAETDRNIFEMEADEIE
jgi:6-pyruvoyltetrahydropterin/6-carboxytetrahydropterin synthase